MGYGLSLQATDTAFGGTRQVSGERRLTQVTVHALAESHWEYRFSGTDSGSCFGDSGGPAATTRNGTALIVGVASYGDETCQQVGGYTRLDVHAQWLLAHTTQAPAQDCGADSQCAGGCAEDADCWPLLCPPGVCTPNLEGCQAQLTTIRGKQCYYVSADGQVCAVSNLVRGELTAAGSSCLNYDSYGLPCGTSCAACNLAGQCSCPLTAQDFRDLDDAKSLP